MKRYAFAGAGGRGIYAYAVPMVREFSDVALPVGVYDVNRKRARLLGEKACADVPVFESCAAMLTEAMPDTVIVTTVDRYHHEYIIEALEAGCDVITEKPMTIDAAKCAAILAAEKRTGRHVTVTFNCRFMPFIASVKALLNDGIIGEVYNAHFEWLLDTDHGADYFRRWHRVKANSGGLLVHKATHHFDIANWFIGQTPEEVCAFGARRFYGPTRDKRGERCLTCPHKGGCEFYFDIAANDIIHELYLDCEDADGYFRDRCVFSDEIDIEDTVSLTVQYGGGATMSYSLSACSPYEAFRLSLNGSGGRMEIEEIYGKGFNAFGPRQIDRLRVYNRRGEEISYSLPAAGGDHGGGDDRLRQMIFRGGLPDPLGQMADTAAGAASVAIGDAANLSMREGRAVKIANLIRLEECSQ